MNKNFSDMKNNAIKPDEIPCNEPSATQREFICQIDASIVLTVETTRNI